MREEAIDMKNSVWLVREMWNFLDPREKQEIMRKYLSTRVGYRHYVMLHLIEKYHIKTTHEEIAKMIEDLKDLRVGWYNGVQKVKCKEVPIKFKPIFAWEPENYEVELTITGIEVKKL